MHNPRFKFGKLPARRDYRIPRMSRYAPLLPAPPRSANYYSEVTEWGVLGNAGPGAVGNCIVAAVDHGIYQERIYANPDLVIVPPTTEEAITTYSAVGGYVRGNPATDQGLYMLGSGSMMEYWAKDGIICGGKLNKPAAYTQITQPNIVEWEQAVAIYGSLLLGLQLPESIVSGEEPPAIWRNWRGPVAGGHEIIAVGYSKPGKETLFDIISWGQRFQADGAFLQHCVDEAVAVANAAFIGASGTDPGGLTLAMLKADMPDFRAV
jgi:hypothetical protein